MSERKLIEWVIAENPEPDPWAEAAIDYLDAMGRVADTYWFYLGPAAESGRAADTEERQR